MPNPLMFTSMGKNPKKDKRPRALTENISQQDLNERKLTRRVPATLPDNTTEEANTADLKRRRVNLSIIVPDVPSPKPAKKEEGKASPTTEEGKNALANTLLEPSPILLQSDGGSASPRHETPLQPSVKSFPAVESTEVSPAKLIPPADGAPPKRLLKLAPKSQPDGEPSKTESAPEPTARRVLNLSRKAPAPEVTPVVSSGPVVNSPTVVPTRRQAYGALAYRTLPASGGYSCELH
ncbi:hypothetical protein AGDE_13841 [Angomonas deanei]|nr:hypothetical protein AGDE_13841 [Angomonas deanei]|eukprot:EPY21715.1 hypothetical protein AGDE_13841 [Angomonas deanei]